jgi:hypothetical protein
MSVHDENGLKISFINKCFVHGENGLKICINFFRFSKVSSFGSNSKGLAFGFTEKCMFTMKTIWNFVFHPREAHILARTNIIVLYTIFLGFKKYQVLAENSKGLAFGFTDICLFMAKMSGEHMGSTGRARGANPLRCVGGRLVGRFGWVGLLRPGDGPIGLSP